MQKELPFAAFGAAHAVASSAIRHAHEHAAQSGWAVQDSGQVGFDFDRWVQNTKYPESDGSGAFWGIFNKERMGTYEDFEQIAQSPKSVGRDELLWHTGRRMGDSFRRLVYQNVGSRYALAEARQAVWGDKTPQWWLLNYGNRYAGAFPQQSGSYSIEQGGWDAHIAMEEIVSRAVNYHLRSVGLLV
jgi:hypothetical protein